MALHGIARAGRPLVAYHEHNAARQRPRVAALLEAGRSVACCSDAGTPLVSDPGYRLVQLAIEGGHPVTALPGASALLPALQLSGLPTDRFLFAGFLPAKPGQRRTALAELAPVPATLVFYESPHRLAESLADMAHTLGPRAAAVSRELTKRFEETVRGPLPDLAARFAGDARPRGEIVVVVAPPEPGAAAAAPAETLDEALAAALEGRSVKDAAREVATRLGLPRREVYERALALRRG
jgi:16S rRNA (cytidine1402-2'-O)-methyltransferase